MSDRSKLGWLVGGVVLLVVLFFTGVGVGAGRDDPPGSGLGLRERLAGLDPTATVDPAVLTTTGPCTLDRAARELRVELGACVLSAPAADGLLRGVSRRVRLVAVDAPLQVRSVVQGRDVTGTVAVGDRADVGFGRAAQDITVSCPPARPCQARLAE